MLDSQSLGAGFDAWMEVYLSFLSFFTCVSRVILTTCIPSPGELRLPKKTFQCTHNMGMSAGHKAECHGFESRRSPLFLPLSFHQIYVICAFSPLSPRPINAMFVRVAVLHYQLEYLQYQCYIHSFSYSHLRSFLSYTHQLVEHYISTSSSALHNLCFVQQQARLVCFNKPWLLEE